MTPWKKFGVFLLLLFAGLFALSVILSDHGILPHRGGRPLQGKAVMKGLEIAIKGYKTEYLKMPEVAAAVSNSTILETRGELLSILLATDKSKNEREIRFWEAPPGKDNGAGFRINVNGEGELRDPWGKNFYRIQLDVEGSGRIPNPAKGTHPDEPDEITSDVIAYSAGPDGDFNTWKDNVKSWR